MSTAGCTVDPDGVAIAPVPLAGLVVVEALSSAAPIALRLTAAMAGRIAADLGARVLLLEPEGGDPLRRSGAPTADGTGAAFAFLSAGKQSVLDRSEISASVLARADAILADAGRADLPAGPVRVLLSMLANGDAPHSEFTVMALSGLLDIVGDPAGPPQRLGGTPLAYAAGLSAYAAMIAALLQRPAPEVARVALLDVAVWLNWKSVAAVAALGSVTSRPGRGAEWPILRCADGHVALVYQPADWPTLRRLCADPRLNEPRFATPEARRVHAVALADIVEECFGGLTRAELEERAMQLRLPLGPVWTVAELRTDPQLAARGFLSGPGGLPRLPLLWNGHAPAGGAAP